MKSKIIIFLLALTLVLPVLTACGGETEQSHDFLIEENSDGTLTIVGWSGLESELVIPEELDGKTVTVIGENAFRAVKGLTSVSVPDTVTAIDYAFVDCKDLKTVTLGKGIRTMNGAFEGCSALEGVTPREGVTEMSEAFKDCTSLKSAYIPSTVTYCASAYRGCTSVTEATVAEGVEALDYVFEGCTSLVTANMPVSVKKGTSVFEGCRSLETVNGELNFTELDCTFKGCSALISVALGDGVTVMKEAFVDCSSLKTIKGLPRKVDSYACSFTGCSSLESAVIPELADENEASKYDISEDIKGCTALKSLDILTSFMVTGEFCKTFSGLSALESMTLTDDVLLKLLRVSSYYEDRIYTGDNSAVYNQSYQSRKASTVRITDDYGYIDGQSYTHIYGYDLNAIDADAIAEASEVLGFESFTRTSYWSGYPKGTNRKNTAVAIERVYTFHLRVTGKNDGSLPPEIMINGINCMTDVMQS